MKSFEINFSVFRLGFRFKFLGQSWSGAGWSFRAWHEKNNREKQTQASTNKLELIKMKSFVFVNGEKLVGAGSLRPTCLLFFNTLFLMVISLFKIIKLSFIVCESSRHLKVGGVKWNEILSSLSLVSKLRAAIVSWDKERIKVSATKILKLFIVKSQDYRLGRH